MNTQFLPALGVLIVIGIGGYYLIKNAPAGRSQSTSGQTTTKTRDLSDNEVAKRIQIEDLKVGEGAEAESGKTITVHYVGTLTNGTQFDSSRGRNEPFEFILGQGQVIPGWDQGIVGMKVGGIRKLTIPPELGYGDQGIGHIPAKSTLIFEIELLEVK